MSEVLTNEFILHKIGWEGWPDALEWFSGGEFEDPAVGQVIDRALDAYIELEKSKEELDNLIGEQ